MLLRVLCGKCLHEYRQKAGSPEAVVSVVWAIQTEPEILQGARLCIREDQIVLGVLIAIASMVSLVIVSVPIVLLLVLLQAKHLQP